jgi:hypothetical protein
VLICYSWLALNPSPVKVPKSENVSVQPNLPHPLLLAVLLYNGAEVHLDTVDLEIVWADVRANEPGTKRYHIGVDEMDDDTIWLWEEVGLRF